MNRNTVAFLTWVTVVLLTAITNSSTADSASFDDPCNNYTSLDQPWRATNETGLNICDRDFSWTGWYRLLYYGMNIFMPESCVDRSRCGTDIALWLSGSHPQIQDGIVTCGVCGRSGSDCCYYQSEPIRVKACPGNYYIYEFVKPTICNVAYCADVNTIALTMTPATVASNVSPSIITTDLTEKFSFDPCNGFNVLDDGWRRTNSNYYTTSSGHDDTLVEWSGWYRLYLQGKMAQLPEYDWYWSFLTCGGYTALLLGGSHPLPQDGIVTRDIYGSYTYVTAIRQRVSYRSNPIQVKACPGDYYVYRLVKPAVSVPVPTYCAVVFNTLSYDPCNNYTTLDQPWRGTNETGLKVCDRDFDWTGWYRLLYYGMNIRMPESCVDESRCGTYITLWLNGSHPQIEDGIVTRGVCGRSESDCCYYSSTPIRVKACPGNYYVYEFVKPATCNSAYCADVDTITPNTNPTSASGGAASSVNTTDPPKNLTFDPCNTYSILDESWRATDRSTANRGHDDTLVEWSGWYRLYLQGKSAQIPETDWCVTYRSCGGYILLFIEGSHPRPQDGIVLREVYGSYDSYGSSGSYVTYYSRCHFYKSNPIEVKSCPGDYYVYRLTKPALIIPRPTYCAAVFNTPSYDPCNNYTVLDQPWRGTNETGPRIYDKYFNWIGWYRLLYNGMNIRMPESCVDESRCSTYTTLWLNGSHPQIEDGIVTRRVCGRSGSDCRYYRSSPIRVKACPGNYYVYEFVKPTTGAYCADVTSVTGDAVSAINTTDPSKNMTFDPCSVYSELKDNWRTSNKSGDYGYDDTLVEWSGWYRLYLQEKSAQIPETDWCWSFIGCGGYTALFLRGSNPLPQDGIVIREIYGYYISMNNFSQCHFYKSNPIQVKACPGDYYVYRLVKPHLSLPRPTYCAVALDTLSYDPCNNYTSLDHPWRGANETGGRNNDFVFKWTGWYRLLYKGRSVRMPETCVNRYRCGTYYPLWLKGPHPRIEDGIVTRGVCGNMGFMDCCMLLNPIRVKACPGNYYVYEFVKPRFLPTAYCADQNFTVSAECKKSFTLSCADNLINQIENSINPVLSPDIVKKALEVQTLQMTKSDENVTFGNEVLNKTEILVSTLVNRRQDNSAFNISVNGLDVHVFVVATNDSLRYSPQLSINSTLMDIDFIQISKNNKDVQVVAVGANVSVRENLQLNMNNAQMDIDLIQISKNNNGSAAVAFMSYTNLSSVLKPSLFNPTDNSEKTMMSIVISATLLKTANPQLTTPVNFTLKHTAEIDPNGTLFCVYWANTEWSVDGCYLLQTNSTHSVCSCYHLSTFALIMLTNPPLTEDNSDSEMEHITTVAVAVGLAFLSLALLTFAACRRNPRVTNTAQINLCISLLLAHLLFLLTQRFLHYIQPQQVACAVLAGVLHFLFLSAFVWMFIEAVLLFISVKNLTKITSDDSAGFWGKWLVVIGYAVPLVMVGMSAALVRNGYGSGKCWLKTEFLWSFLGPVGFILAANTVLFIAIMIILTSALTNMRSEMLRIRRSESDQQLFKIVTLKAMIQFIILGCPWILGFFTDHSKMLEIIFILLNSQQGTFIFLVHCVLNPEVRRIYMKWWRDVCAAQVPRNQDTTTSEF